jgi:hypothetical protein
MSIQYTYQAPLTHRAHGPGLILVITGRYSDNITRAGPFHLDPPPAQKWAEEGFCVLCITAPGHIGNEVTDGKWAEVIMQAYQQLKEKIELKGEKFGLIGVPNTVWICFIVLIFPEDC